MKSVKYLLFIFFVMIPSVVLADFNPGSYSCDLDELAASGYKLPDTACYELTIKSTNNLDFLKEYNGFLSSLSFNGVKIHDFSFLNGISEVQFVDFRNSDVDLRTFPSYINGGEFISYYFDETNIVNDDFKNVVGGYSSFYFYDCWLKSLESLRNGSFNNFTISGNKYLHLDLSPLLTVSTGNSSVFSVSITGFEHNVSQELIDYLNSFEGIDGVTDVEVDPSSSESESIMNDFNELYDSLDLDSKNADEQIKAITLKVIDEMSFCAYSGSTPLKKALSGCGTSKEYSYLTAALLQKAGFSAYVMNGYTNSSNKSGTATYWVNIYYKGTWRGIDVYNLDNTTGRQNVVDGTYTPYYLGYVDDSDFSYNHMTDSKINVLIDESLTIKFIDGVEDKVMSLPVSLEHYVLPTPIKEGYTFDGWYLENTYVTKVSSATELKKNGNLYAKWTKNPETPVIEETEREVDGPIPNPESGIFVGLFIVLPILMLFGLEYLKNKNNSKVYKI